MHKIAVVSLVLLLVTLLVALCQAVCQAGKFTSHPQNLTVLVGQTGVALTCSLNVTQAWVWSQRVGTVEVFTSNGGINLNNKDFVLGNGSSYPRGALIHTNPVRITDHGMYQCRYPGCADSYIGQLNVEGKPQLDFFPLNTPLNFTLTAGSNVVRTLLTYGYPSPTFTLRKMSSGGEYTDVTASELTFTVNSETLTMSGVEQSHSGDYQIVATNSHGSYMLNFTLTVTGVGPPCPMTISPMSSQVTPTQYNSEVVLSCSTPDDSYDPDSQNQLQILWRYSNGTEITSNNYFDVEKVGNTQQSLRIKMLTTDLNGNYICFANNTRDSCTKQVTVIGPPEPISDLNATRSGNGYVTLAWTPPRAFGANISMYEIEYRLNDGAKKSFTVMNTRVTRQFCSSGTYQFHVIAINEHNAMSGESNIKTVNISANDDCLITVPILSSSGIETTVSTPSIDVSPSVDPEFSPNAPVSSDNLIGLITAGVVIALILVLFFICSFLSIGFCCCYLFLCKSYRSRLAKRQPSKKVELSASGSVTTSLENSYVKDINTPNVKAEFIPLISNMLILNWQLRLMDVIGQGEFGIVYKAHLLQVEDDDIIVAVKTLIGSFDAEAVNDLVMESIKMKNFQHRHVMGLLGVCLDAGPAPYLVLPYMANGNLLSYLKTHRDTLILPIGVKEDKLTMVETKLLSMCLQIVSGMQYLASMKIVHRDLAARNCMIDDAWVIKVADFGLTKSLYEKQYFRLDKKASMKLPIKWMAIESINDAIFTEKTDVWSFGVTCWEVFSGGMDPYGGLHPFSIVRMLRDGERLDAPGNAACSSQVFDKLMRQCWDSVPDKRPTFSQLCASVDAMLTIVAGYMELSEFTETPL